MFRLSVCGLVIIASVLVSRPALAQIGRLRAEEKTIMVEQRERSYLLLAPRRSTGPLPLVFVLHGGGGNARQMERHTGFNRMAMKEGFLLCYPQGFEKNWNDGRGVDFIPAHKQDVDDVKFLRRVVEAVGQSHNVDRSRVFATGISNGAFMSHRLAAEAADVFSAVAPLVGGMAGPIAKKFQPKRPVSLLVIQGDSDPLVPLAGGEVGLRRARKRGKFIATQETITKYLAANKIQGEPHTKRLPDRDPDDGTTTTATLYPPSDKGARVHLYVVKNGGHGWPGAPAYAPERLIGKVSQDFDASEVIWQFFKSCPPRPRTR